MSLRIEQFVWVRQTHEKLIDKHGISPNEVEEVFFNRPRFRFHEKGRVRGEDMYSALGQTGAGHNVIVFFTFMPTNRALIISARDINRSERTNYGKK